MGKGAGEFEDLLSLVFIMLSAVDCRLPVIFPNGREVLVSCTSVLSCTTFLTANDLGEIE